MPVWQGGEGNETKSLLYPICGFLTPVPSSALRCLFPLDEEVSSEWEDPKEGEVFLASDL